MATTVISTTETHRQWTDFFLPEGRAHVARRQELGDYVSDPSRCARIYASFAAFDAMQKADPKYRELDFDRAREIAEIMAKLPNGIDKRHQVTTVQTLAA
ncbi:MAG: hypothetical protein M3Q08_01660 [Pseudomonadota bacterium]|nr:hypothetical protein [Pseudomonadota bacterium]